MAAKVVGFTKRVDGYRTIAGKMTNEVFVNACKAMAERTGASLDIYLTKRQAGKFFRGQGIVFDNLNNG